MGTLLSYLNMKVAAIVKQIFVKEGRGGGQVVSMLASNTDNPSSKPTEAQQFCCKIVLEKKKNRLVLAQ